MLLYNAYKIGFYKKNSKWCFELFLKYIFLLAFGSDKCPEEPGEGESACVFKLFVQTLV